MPQGISHSLITPAALQTRTTEAAPATERPRENLEVAETDNPQAVLTGSSQQLVRAAAAGTGSQAPDNQLGAQGGSEPTGRPVDAQSQNGQEAVGLGSSLDLVG